MATINRFTKHSNPRFDPMSLQELMMVPSYKRQKHDELEAANVAMETKLAEIDPLDVHSELAMQEQERLYKALQDQAEQLNSEGFNNNTKSNLLKINKDYQRTVGPTGNIGRINAAKQAFNAEKEAFYKDGIAKGHSKDTLDTNWQKYSQNYSGYDENGKIKNIDPLGASLMFDVKKDVMDVAGKLGSTQGVNMNNVKVSTIQTPNGEELVFLDKVTGEKLSNSDQLSAYTNALLQDYQNPDTSRGQFAEFTGLKKTDIAGMINSYGKSLETTEQTLNRSVSPLNNPYSVDNKREGAVKKESTIYEDPQELINTEVSSRSYDANQKEMTALLNTDPSDPDYDTNILKGRAMQDILSRVKEDLSKNPEYISNQKVIDEIAKGESPNYLSIMKSLASPSEDNAEWMRTSTEDGISTYENIKTGEVEQFPADKEAQMLRDYTSIKTQIDKNKEIADQLISEKKIPYVGYVVDKTLDTQGYWKTHTNQVIDVMMSQGAIGNAYDIDSYYVGSTGDTKGLRPGGEVHIRKSMFDELYKASKEGRAEITKMYPKGANGLPMIEFRFSPSDDFEVDGSGKWNDDNVTKGEPVTMRVTLDEFNGKSAPLVQNLMISSLETQGGSKGTLLAQDMRSVAKYKDIASSTEPYATDQTDAILRHVPWFTTKGVKNINIYKDPKVGKFQYYVDTGFDEIEGYEGGTLKWNHLLNPSVINDPQTLSKLPPNLLRHFNSYFTKLNPYGIDETNINSVSDESLDKYLTDFLRTYGDQAIEFDSKERALNTFN